MIGMLIAIGVIAGCVFVGFCRIVTSYPLPPVTGTITADMSEFARQMREAQRSIDAMAVRIGAAARPMMQGMEVAARRLGVALRTSEFERAMSRLRDPDEAP